MSRRWQRAIRTLQYHGWSYIGHVGLRIFWPQAKWAFAKTWFGFGKKLRVFLALVITSFFLAIAGIGIGTTAGWIWMLVCCFLLVPLVAASISIRSTLRINHLPAGGLDSATRPLLKWQEWQLSDETLAEFSRVMTGSGDDVVEIARIDNDGRFTSRFGPIPGGRMISEESFVPRYRYDLSLVVYQDFVGIRKDYRGDKGPFRREVLALEAIAGKAPAPVVLDVDQRRVVLLKTFEEGPTLRDFMVESGARILTEQVETEPDFARRSGEEQNLEVWRRGREALVAKQSGDLVIKIQKAMEAIHRCGVTGFSLTFGNVVLKNGEHTPVFVDFDSARVHRSVKSSRFRFFRDRDREIFNRIYGTTILTERSAKGLLAEFNAQYAPVDIGRGMVSPGFWSIESGAGRWRIVKRAGLEELVKGKSVLDLGTNNGFMALMMLRAGADSVTAVERDPSYCRLVSKLQSLIEWADLREYDLELVNDDMLAAVRNYRGKADVVTAFCSLYYLGHEEMREILVLIREMNPFLVLQANDATRKEAADNKAAKSASIFMKKLAETSGFSFVEVVGPAGYSRPLLYCRTDDTNSL